MSSHILTTQPHHCLDMHAVNLEGTGGRGSLWRSGQNRGQESHLTSAVTEPSAELLRVGPPVSVKLCSPEGCFLNRSRGTVATASRPREQGQEGPAGDSQATGLAPQHKRAPFQDPVKCQGHQSQAAGVSWPGGGSGIGWSSHRCGVTGKKPSDTLWNRDGGRGSQTRATQEAADVP